MGQGPEAEMSLLHAGLSSQPERKARDERRASNMALRLFSGVEISPLRTSGSH